MPIIPLTCPNCGGKLETDSDLEAALCSYCGTPFVVKDAIVKNYINNVTNISLNGGTVNVFNQKDFVIEGAILRKYRGESTNVVIPSSVNEIGEKAFEGLKYVDSVSIPNSVVSIESGAFSGCSSLKNIVIPNSVKKMGAYVFFECTHLEKITIPNSVTSILKGPRLKNNDNEFRNIDGHFLFDRCPSLVKVKVPGLVIDSPFAFLNCSNLCEVIITSPTKRVGISAFENCSKLKKIDLSEGATAIKRRAFFNCKSLEEVLLPNGLERIDPQAFYGCEKLTKLIIPDSLQLIGYDFAGIYSPVFEKCNNLTIFGKQKRLLKTEARKSKVRFEPKD